MGHIRSKSASTFREFMCIKSSNRDEKTNLDRWRILYVGFDDNVYYRGWYIKCGTPSKNQHYYYFVINIYMNS